MVTALSDSKTGTTGHAPSARARRGAEMRQRDQYPQSVGQTFYHGSATDYLVIGQMFTGDAKLSGRSDDCKRDLRMFTDEQDGC
jgi:hypothetical protein